MSGALEKLRISFLGRSIDRSIDRRFNATWWTKKSGEGGGGGGVGGIISNDKRDERTAEFVVSSV